MRERGNAELVKQAYERFRSGDIPGLMALYADDIGWEPDRHEGGGGLRRKPALAKADAPAGGNADPSSSTFIPCQTRRTASDTVLPRRYAHRLLTARAAYGRPAPGAYSPLAAAGPCSAVRHAPDIRTCFGFMPSTCW
ncbi:nuclear transport factor 2 family protein [Noviherbaspirillum aerium]|uniref:nuclear transport factor 2 family protein n=1 Tax=Noviherbaspirillum aerium TaxID=2588497 RepID=UPI00124E73B9|nr:hypothetical protein [Noviherbaspirillum aerium]